jgi:CRP-like cAMP-binding protein
MNNLFENLKLLAPFEDNDLQILKSCFILEKINKGDCVLREGQICKKIYYINSGCFKAYYIADGKENVLEFFIEDDWFVELSSFINEIPSPFYIEAIENSEIYYLSKEKFEVLRDNNHNWERFYCRLLEKHISRFIYLLNQKRSFSNEERYKKILKNRPNLINRIPQYLIASYLGLTTEGLSKLRRRTAKK